MVSKVQDLLALQSQYSIVDLKRICLVGSKEEIEFMVKGKQEFRMSIDNCLDVLEGLESLTLENGNYMFGGEVAFTVAENYACGQKYLAMLQECSMNEETKVNTIIEKDYYNPLMAITDNIDTFNQVQSDLLYIEQNRMMMSKEKADFSILKPKNVRTPPFCALVNVKGSVKINGFFYAPTTEVNNIVKNCKLKDVRLIWKAIKKILDEQGGLEIDMNGVMNMSQEAKKEKKARDRQKIESEKDYLNALEKNLDSQIMYYMMFLVEIGRAKQVDTVEDCKEDYAAWVEEQSIQEERPDKTNDDDDIDNRYEHIIGSKRKLDQQCYTETIKHFKTNVTKGPEGLKILDSKSEFKVPRPNNSVVAVEDFCNYLKNSNLTGIACLFSDKDFFDEKIEIFSKLYVDTQVNVLKAQLKSNLKYLAFRKYGNKMTIDADVPYFILMYEIYQMLQLTVAFVNRNAIPQGFKKYSMDVMMYYWINAITQDFKPNFKSNNYFLKTVRIPNANVIKPTDYKIQVKAGKVDSYVDTDSYF